VVEVQLPSTVDRAILLAQTQQEVLERGKMKVTRPYVGDKMLNTRFRGEGLKKGVMIYPKKDK